MGRIAPETTVESREDAHGGQLSAGGYIQDPTSLIKTEAGKFEVSSGRQIPIVDMTLLGGSEEEQEKIAEQIARACETWGFFQLVNHGIDLELLHRVQKVAMGFHKLPEQEKEECYLDGVPGGYNTEKTKFGSLANAHAPDTLFNYWSPPSMVARTLDRFYPRNPPAYRSTMEEYFKETAALGQKLLPMMSKMLGLRPERLPEIFAGETGEALGSMRVNYYPPSGKDEEIVGLDAHADPGGFTVLLQGDVVGLQVNYEDEWVTVVPIPDALVVNVGDQIEILSNGRYKSSLHRGMTHPAKERLSIAVFHNPMYDTMIGPIEELHPPTYTTQSFGDYFKDFLKIGFDGKAHILSRRVH